MPLDSIPELDSLCQRQRVRVIHRDRLPPHVRLPRIATALASAAGILLAAESAADLGAAGSDIDVGDAAIAAARRKNVRTRASLS